ncbi:hypothetical protein O9K51_01365 [Purpureocillium lavendulum]|uniref:Uncharacterized protein n=1 Tax=Purpureocillium lavendulum TaxID=1247861 RepID=A0AB34G4Q6_9HYPO|nr:hypothetical protein O9K51_01365 [Purpureocillium lavendulum]
MAKRLGLLEEARRQNAEPSRGWRIWQRSRSWVVTAVLEIVVRLGGHELHCTVVVGVGRVGEERQDYGATAARDEK